MDTMKGPNTMKSAKPAFMPITPPKIRQILANSNILLPSPRLIDWVTNRDGKNRKSGGKIIAKNDIIRELSPNIIMFILA